MNTPRALGWFRRIARRLQGDESGFTLIELTVATGVVLTALVLMGGVITSGLTSAAIARERQSANGLANQTLEQIRALPFSTLRAGHATSDLADTAGTTDPKVTTDGCGGGTYCFQGERLVHGSSPAVDPLVPHNKTIPSNDSTNKTFTVASYVTYYENNLTADTYRVTADVTWTSSVRSGSAESLEVQTIIFPNGCTSLPEHTYSGPCLSSFTSTAMADAPAVSANGSVGTVAIERAVLYGGSATSDATIEQTSRVDGITQGSGAVLQALAGDEQAIGQSTVASQANNDPGASKPIHHTADLPTQGQASSALSSSTGTLTAHYAGGDSGRTTSTTSANSAASRPCPYLTGQPNDDDSLPCGGSSATSGSASLTVDGAAGVGSVPLATIGAQSAPTTATIDRASGSGLDMTQATVSRSALSFGLGGLPSIARPAGFDHIVKLTGYSDSATAQAGTGSSAPSLSTSGQLEFWNGSDYDVVSITDITPSNVPMIPPMSVHVDDVTINLAAVVTSQVVSTTEACPGTCTRASASANVTPIKLSVTLTIIDAGETVVDLSTVLDPGTIQAKTSYVAAPTS